MNLREHPYGTWLVSMIGCITFGFALGCGAMSMMHGLEGQAIHDLQASLDACRGITPR